MYIYICGPEGIAEARAWFICMMNPISGLRVSMYVFHASAYRLLGDDFPNNFGFYRLQDLQNLPPPLSTASHAADFEKEHVPQSSCREYRELHVNPQWQR